MNISFLFFLSEKKNSFTKFQSTVFQLASARICSPFDTEARIAAHGFVVSCFFRGFSPGWLIYRVLHGEKRASLDWSRGLFLDPFFLVERSPLF